MSTGNDPLTDPLSVPLGDPLYDPLNDPLDARDTGSANVSVPAVESSSHAAVASTPAPTTAPSPSTSSQPAQPAAPSSASTRPVSTPSSVPAGYSTVDASFTVEPVAARMLPQDAPAVGIAIAGNVLMVAAPRPLSPATFRDLERLSGMPITVAIANPADYGRLREAALRTRPQASPHIIGSALEEAAESRASDVLLSVGDVPRMRVSGSVAPIGRFPVLTGADLDAAAQWLLGDLPQPSKAIEGVVAFGQHRWRVSMHHAAGHPAVAARRMAPRPPRLEDLGVPGAVVDLARARHGLVLFTGAPGAGKTTSAAALIDRINSTRQAHIVTVESPIEYQHVPLSAAVTQREVGTDVLTFDAGIHEALRQSADVVYVGDLRDPDSARAALTAALGGHLVIATMAAPTVETALHRILTMFGSAEQEQLRSQLASALRAVIAQQLLPAAVNGQSELVCEVLLGDDAAKSIIRSGRTHELVAGMENSVQSGMTSMDRALAYYVAAGRVSEADARAAAVDPSRFDEHLRRAPGAVRST